LSLLLIQWRRSQTPVPLINIVELNVDGNVDNNDNPDNNKGVVLRGGRDDK
jgi:hypothetical protein